MEDTQLAQVRDDTNDSVDQVADRLEDGADPQQAVENMPPAGFGLLEVTDESGRVVASVATFTSGGPAVSIRLSNDREGPATEVSSAPPDRVVSGEPPRSDIPEGADMSGAVVGVDGLVAGSFERISRTVDTPSGQLTVTAAAPVDQVARSVDARQGS